MADTPRRQGGWNTPDPASGTTLPVPQAATGDEKRGYKVKALPDGLPDLPDNPGGWHRPRAEDTLLKPTDETIILTPVSDEPAALPPEALPATTQEIEKFLSPEDVLALLDDGPTLKISRYDDEADEPLSPEDALAALPLTGDEDDDEDDAQSGIRSEMMALGLLASTGTSPTTPAPDTISTQDAEAVAVTSDDDPAAIARKRMEELMGGGGASAAAPSGPTQAALESERMANEVLGLRFFNVQQDMAQLRLLLSNGQITPEQAEAEIAARNLMIQTDDGRYWRMNVYEPTWIRSTEDGMGWEPVGTPKWLENYLSTQRMNPNDPLNAGLPLLSTGPAEASGGMGGAATIPMGSLEYMPLPNQVPTNDMGQTVVGGAAFRDQLDMTDMGAQPTVAGRTVAGATVVGSSVGYGSAQPAGIPSAYDESLPPDLDYEAEGELAEQADMAYRQNTTRNIVLVAVGLIGLVLIVAVGGLLAANAWYDGIVEQYDSQIDALADYEPAFQTVIIQDVNGNEIARLADAGDRTEVSLNEINPYFIHAVVSTRNPTFFTDPGWDTGTTISAYIESFGGNRITAEKTITQLVAESLVLGGGNTDATDADLIVVAGELSKRYDKDFILELFLNEFPFGNNTYGVEAAARFYLGKSAADLTLVDSALLAAIMENPNTVDPVSNRQIKAPLLNVARRMSEVGCLTVPGRGQTCVQPADIDDNCTDGTQCSPTFISNLGSVELLPFRPRRLTTEYPHFVQLVRQQLEAVYGQDLYTRGFTVKTTINPTIQQSAQALLRQHITTLSGTGLNTGAVVYLDNTSGAVRAYLGSPDFNNAQIQGQRDHLRDFLKPGTTIIPLMYAAGLEGVDKNGNGALEINEYITPASVTWDVQSTYTTSDSASFTPLNPDGRFYGAISVRDAMANQLASTAARTYLDLGEGAFRGLAERIGLNFPTDAAFSPQTAVGETPVRPIDLVSAYSTFATGGAHRHWYVIDSITDSNGNAVPLPEVLKRPEQSAVTAQTAYLMTNILSDDLARNPQIIPRNSALTIVNKPNQGFVAAVAGQDTARTSFWTIGTTSTYSIGVWIGTPNADVSVQRQTGLSAAAPLWNVLMRQIVESVNTPNFTDPGGMARADVCPLTGTAFSTGCPAALRNELFVATRMPPQPGEGLIVSAAVNTWTNQRANSFCPNAEDTVQRSFLNTADPFVLNYFQTNEGRALAQRLGLGTVISPVPTAECDQNYAPANVVINSPTQGQTLMGQVPIVGQVAANADFSRYTVEIAPAGTQNFTTLAGFPVSNQQPTAGSTLATWDTTQVAGGTGSYTVRVTAVSTTGGYIQRSVTVTLNNPTPTPTPSPTPTLAPVPTLALNFTPLPFDPLITPVGVGPTNTPAPF